MKSKSYFVDRIIKLRGGEGDKDELMKLQMVDILKVLNEERTKQAKPAEPDDLVDMIPKEEDDEPVSVEELVKPVSVEEPVSDSDDDGVISIVRRFLFTPAHKD
jgi:hypothetical protein